MFAIQYAGRVNIDVFATQSEADDALDTRLASCQDAKSLALASERLKVVSLIKGIPLVPRELKQRVEPKKIEPRHVTLPPHSSICPVHASCLIVMQPGFETWHTPR